MSEIYDRACTTCGHKINDHDANECWKTVDGLNGSCKSLAGGHDWSA